MLTIFIYVQSLFFKSLHTQFKLMKTIVVRIKNVLKYLKLVLSDLV